MEPQNTQSTQTVADKTYALRFTGDAPVHLGEIHAESLNSGFTLEAWVRPTAVERGVVVFPEERFNGSGVAFGPGRYDDLGKYRIGSRAIQSLRVPPGYQAILFAGTGCTGNARTIENDVISLGEAWNNSAHSLLVFDRQNATQSYAVVYQEPNFAGAAAVLAVRRYEALTFLPAAQTSFASMLIPPGLEVTLYDQPRCQGASSSQQGAVADIGNWAGRVHSLALTKSGGAAAAKTAASPSPAARTARIFTAASGDGLWLDIAPSASPVRPPDILFAGTPLGAGRWHHLAQTFDGTHLVAYVNGRVAHTSLPKTAPNLSGEWAMGSGFYGDIGLVSLRRGARSAAALRATRFNLPQFPEPEPAGASDETSLHAAWTLDRSDDEPLVEIRTETTTDLPAGEVFWVAAQLPRSLLASGLGRKALSQAAQRRNAAQHKARLEGQAALDKAHQKAQEKRRKAHAQAQANAHAARFKDIRSIVGGAMIKVGPGGKELESPNLWANAVFSDIAVDAATGFTYLAFHQENGSRYSVHRYGKLARVQRPEWLFDRAQPIHALAVDSAGEHGQKYVYWIEGAGTLCRGPANPGAEASVLLPVMIPGRAGEWHLAFDARQARLFWSNGREIWCGTPTSDNKLTDWRVFVPHGRSPHPIALAVDDETGDLFWLDKDLEMVRTCDSDGKYIRDLYEALDPREGIALDYFDLAQLPAEQAEHPALALKRLYWNAEYRKMVEAAVIDDPGLFCRLQHVEGRGRPKNTNEALEDVHFVGVRWNQVDEPQRLSEEGEYFATFFHTLDHTLNAITVTPLDKQGTRYAIRGWDAATEERTTLFEWRRQDRGNPPAMFAFNETGAQLLYSNRQSAAIFDMHTGTHRELAGHHHDRYGEAGIEGIALSADGQLAILGSRDNTLSVWDAVSGAWLRSLEGHTNQVQCVITYAMGDKQYALSGSYDNTLKHWDLATGACLQTLAGHTGIIVEIDITEDRRRVVSASFDNTARVWDLASGACLQTLTGHKNVVRGVTIHPDGRRAISASADTTLKMWDMTTGQCLHTFEGHTADVYGSAVSADGRQLISVGRDGAFQWDLHRHVWVLHFDGRADYVDLGPLYLNCGQGFSAELQICLETLEHEQAVFSLGNGDDGGNISLTVDGRGELVFAVEDHGTVNQIETDGSMPLSTGQWYTVSLAVDSAGAAVFHVNGQNAGEGLTPVPRTCLRLHNEVGRSNRSRSAHLHGKVGMLRLWNRALTPDEIQKFHQRPRATPKAPLPVYHRSVLEYRNGRPYLMSGMSNGSTPPIAMFELAVDKGLAVQSKSTTAHAKLLAAQHKKQAADEKAAADRANARLAAQATVNAAHAQNQADHAHAQHRLDTAHADAAQQRAEAHQRLTVTTQRAQQQVNDARAGARRQKTDAEQRAERIKDDGYRKADRIKRNANQNLQNAQAEKAKYE